AGRRGLKDTGAAFPCIPLHPPASPWQQARAFWLEQGNAGAPACVRLWWSSGGWVPPRVRAGSDRVLGGGRGCPRAATGQGRLPFLPGVALRGRTETYATTLVPLQCGDGDSLVRP